MILMHEDKMIAGLVPEEGGGGGHVIQDASGTAVAQEPTMQFADSHVSDDSTNEKTVIENIKPLTGAEFDVVTEDGFYAITDEDDATMEDTSADYVEVVAGGGKTWGQLLDELFNEIDTSKITEQSFLKFTYTSSAYCIYHLVGNYIPTSKVELRYSFERVSDATITIETCYLISSGSKIYSALNNTVSDVSGNTASGKITLYYGTDSCVTDLINQAKYTYMESGESVEDAIENVFNYKTLLTSSDDLNTIFDVGNYRCMANSIPTNAPPSNNGKDGTIKVEYTESDSMYIQTYEEYVNGMPYTYKRRYFSGAWGNWFKLTWSAIS